MARSGSSSALYEGDHYELGILFVQDERTDGEKIGYDLSFNESFEWNHYCHK